MLDDQLRSTVGSMADQIGARTQAPLLPAADIVDRKGHETMLMPCAGFWHECLSHHGNPKIVVVPEAICTEFRLADKWGFFDPDGFLIPEATDFNGLSNEFMFQVPELYCNINDVKDNGLSDLIYGGRVVLHFGHFLLESLPRLWAIAQTGLNGRKVLFQSGHALVDWYNTPFVAPCMHALGIKQSDVVQVSAPEKVRDVLVPLPCMQQDAFVYPAAASRLFRKISDHMLRGTDTRPNDTPVYLSKSRYKRRGTGIVNEEEIETALRNMGVDIVYPEEWSLKDQIALFKSRKVILGALGSAFHTAAFAQPAGRQIILAHNSIVNPNYLLFDIAGGNSPEYVYTDDIVILGQTAEIGYAMECRNPRRVAEDLFRRIDQGAPVTQQLPLRDRQHA